MPDAPGGDPVGFEGLGVAISLHPGPLRALRRRAEQAAQEAHRVGLAVAFAGQALAATAREIVAVADSTYASLKLLDRCRRLTAPITFITRLRLDAALYEPAPLREPHQLGRPRLKGGRLPNLCAVAEDSATVWRTITVADWYGEGERTVEVVSQTALWYSTGLPAVPLRWVLIRDPQGGFETQALLCTDLSADPQRIISWFVRRLSDGGHFPRSSSAIGLRDPEAVVRKSNLEDRSGAVGVVLIGHAIRPPAHVRRCGCPPKNSLVRQEASDLLRRSGGGAQEAVGTGAGDFSRVAAGYRHTKSPTRVRRTANRRGLLCGLMAKVQQRNCLKRGTSSAPMVNLAAIRRAKWTESPALVAHTATMQAP